MMNATIFILSILFFSQSFGYSIGQTTMDSSTLRMSSISLFSEHIDLICSRGKLIKEVAKVFTNEDAGLSDESNSSRYQSLESTLSNNQLLIDIFQNTLNINVSTSTDTNIQTYNLYSTLDTYMDDEPLNEYTFSLSVIFPQAADCYQSLGKNYCLWKFCLSSNLNSKVIPRIYTKVDSTCRLPNNVCESILVSF